MKLLEDFICSHGQNTTTEFSGSDQETLFTSNLKTQSSDWIYRTKKVVYNYNSLGFRCKNIKDIDFDNYILFTGCSHTEGVGLALEDTYPYKVAKELNCDYYNLAMGSTGIDVLEHNLVTWFLKFNKKPKYVFVQWPDHSRYAGVFPEYDSIIPIGAWRDDPLFQKFITSAELTGYSYAKKFLASKLLHNVIDVPVIDIQFSALSSFQPYDLFIKRIDYARDILHSGIRSNENITKQILEHIFIWRDRR